MRKFWQQKLVRKVWAAFKSKHFALAPKKLTKWRNFAIWSHCLPANAVWADRDALLDLVSPPTGWRQAAAELEQRLDVDDVLSFVDERLQVAIFSHLEIILS